MERNWRADQATERKLRSAPRAMERRMVEVTLSVRKQASGINSKERGKKFRGKIVVGQRRTRAGGGH